MMMKLPKAIGNMSWAELRSECNKRCLRYTAYRGISKRELSKRLREFIGNEWFIQQRNELMIHGYMRKLEKKRKYKHFNIPIYLVQIMVKYCPIKR